jgi:putative transposase
MKKHFSDEQIISILREAEAGVSARELCRKHARLKKLLAEAMLDKEALRWLWGESTDDRPEAGNR